MSDKGLLTTSIVNMPIQIPQSQRDDDHHDNGITQQQARGVVADVTMDDDDNEGSKSSTDAIPCFENVLLLGEENATLTAGRQPRGHMDRSEAMAGGCMDYSFRNQQHQQQSNNRKGFAASGSTAKTCDSVTTGSDATRGGCGEPQATEKTAQPPTASSSSFKFDLTQPWQRSLQRELGKIDLFPSFIGSAPDDDDVAAAAAKLADRPELVLLGHAASGDFAQIVDRDDDVSLGTNASSTISSNSRPQMIHRGAIPLFSNPDDDTSSQKSSKRSNEMRLIPASPINQHYDVDDEEEERDETMSTLRSEEIGRPSQIHMRNAGSMHSYPHLSRGDYDEYEQNLERTQAFSEDYQSPYVELRVNTDDFMDPMANGGPQCFCWAYSISDFLFPPPTTTKHTKSTNPANIYNRRKHRVSNYWGIGSPSVSKLNGISEVSVDMKDEHPWAYRHSHYLDPRNAAAAKPSPPLPSAEPTAMMAAWTKY